MKRELRFCIVDVFTERRFGGNQLAVLPDARGLTDGEMQHIAAEFNFSETTFVLPPEQPANTRRVRIFTPRQELPFAGHPNVGTAFVLAKTRAVPWQGEPLSIRFEEDAGIVSMEVKPGAAGNDILCRLEAPQALRILDKVSTSEAAALAGLDPGSISTARHEPVIASVGVPFLYVELESLEALGRASPDRQAFLDTLPPERATGIHLYTRAAGDGRLDLRARMFAPLLGVVEDPATGAANCALAGLLASTDPDDGDHAWRIGQGIEMGRPSLLHAGARKRNGQAEKPWLEGSSVMVAEGTLHLR